MDKILCALPPSKEGMLFKKLEEKYGPEPTHREARKLVGDDGSGSAWSRPPYVCRCGVAFVDVLCRHLTTFA